MRAINTEYYGDETRWFIGKVVTKGVEKDPAGLGRVRVRIVGVHDNDLGKIKNSDLPFASMMMPNTEGGTFSTTQTPMLQNDAVVFGVFLDGEISQQPLILGSIPYQANRVLIDHKNTGERIPNNDDLSIISTPSQSAARYSPGTATEIEIELLDNAGISHDLQPGQQIPPNLVELLATTVAGSGNVNIELVGVTQAQQTFNFLRTLFTELKHKNPGYVAAGFVGNFVHESGVQSAKQEVRPLVAGSKGGWGIAQWTGPRRSALENFARQQRAYVGNLAVQLAWIEQEMIGTASNYGKWSDFSSGFMSLIKSCNTIKSTTEAVYSQYEKPQVVLNFEQLGPGYGSKFVSYIRRGGIENRLNELSSKSSYTQDYFSQYKKRRDSAIDAYSKYSGG